MVYRAIGIMSGSSLDGLDIVFADFQEQGGKWRYEIRAADCFSYPPEWVDRLKNAIDLNARDYLLLHSDYGHYLGEQVNSFIEQHQLHYQVGLVCSHGHTTFHMPARGMTAQLGDGAAIASEVRLPVVTDLRAIDVAFGGQGAPIVPVGEKYLLGDYDFFLNLGGIANLSMNDPGNYIAFDVCPANRVLNMIANQVGKEFDDGGQLAATGKMDGSLLDQLNKLEYYGQAYPKSLANDFGTDIIYPIITRAQLNVEDALRTYVEHIAIQVRDAVGLLKSRRRGFQPPAGHQPLAGLQLLVTGGGALNSFLTERISSLLLGKEISVVVPGSQLVNFKEALIMAFIGVLRWRQEYNVISTVTGAERNTVGGALWTGEEA